MAPRILIADDNESLGVALQGLLGKKGLEVELAVDGIQALERTLASLPDVLVLDLKLPRLHGIDVLRKLRAKDSTKNLPIILITGAYSEQKYKNATAKFRPIDYLVKPFRTEQLLKAIQQGLKAAETARAPFVQHLQCAFTEKFSGRCILSRGPRQHTLEFIQGVPVAINPGFTDAGLADFLYRKSLISELERDFYSSTQPQNPQLFVEMGCMLFEDLQEELRSYLENELIEAFALPPLAADFKPEERPRLPIPLNLPALIHAGFSQHPDARQKALFEQYRLCFVAPSKEYFNHINFLRLNEDEKLFANKMDGNLLLAECASGEEKLLPLFQTLHWFGMLQLSTEPLTAVKPENLPIRTLFNDVELAPSAVEEEELENFFEWIDEDAEEIILPKNPLMAEPEQLPPGEDSPQTEDLGPLVRSLAESIKGKDHYQTFDLDRENFTLEALKEAYFTITRQLGPETLMHLGGEESTLAEEVLSTVATAYNTLSDEVSKERYDALFRAEDKSEGQQGDDTLQAQVRAQAGKVFIEKEEWDNAEKALQDACNIEPKNGDYLAHLAWAIFRNPRNAGSETLQRKAIQIVNRALTLERSADAFAFKGWMMLEGGQEKLAEAEFNKVLKLNARHGLARQGLHTLQERRNQKNKGLFRRFFG